MGSGNIYVAIPQFEQYSGHGGIDFIVQKKFMTTTIEELCHPVFFL
jgi:hypothetical protein